MGEYTERLKTFWAPESLSDAQDHFVATGVKKAAWQPDNVERQARVAIADIPIQPGATILDFGCGVGRLSREWARMGYHVIAIDVSAAMLKYAREYCGTFAADIEFVLSDGYGCGDVAENSVDVAISTFCFQHMPDWDVIRSCLRSMRRVIRPDGWVRAVTRIGRHRPPDTPVSFVGVRQPPHALIEAAALADLHVTGLKFDLADRYSTTWRKQEPVRLDL